jgi:general transcription factor 3C polypeptide 5 (transcription factor C subunit 1)
MIIENLMDADNVKLSEELKEKSSIICSSRARRTVFTITYSFVKDNSNVRTHVPQEALQGAIEDIKKRPNFENSVELIKNFFDIKPVWSKVALDIEAKHISTAFSLKYILPVLAYFATNGPWRALWIRLGYDPREHQAAFLYQTVDFRVPGTEIYPNIVIRFGITIVNFVLGIYKCHIDDPEKSDETFYIFKPNTIPPRGQMFYQVIKLNDLYEIS